MKISKRNFGCNTITIYSCDVCNGKLFQDPSDDDIENYEEWKFCPYCGNPIDYDNLTTQN